MADRNLNRRPSLGDSRSRRTNVTITAGQHHRTEAQLDPPWTQRPNNQQRSAPLLTTSQTPLQRSTVAPVHVSTSSAQAHPNVHYVHPQLSVNYENARRVIPSLPPLSQLLQQPSPPAPVPGSQSVDDVQALRDYHTAIQLQEIRQELQAVRLGQETVEGDVIELTESMTTVIALLRQRSERDNVVGRIAQAQAALVREGAMQERHDGHEDDVRVKEEGGDTDSLFEDAYNPHLRSFGR